MIALFAIAALKPLAGLLLAPTSDLSATNAAGIPAWQPTVVAAWCLFCGLACYSKENRVGRPIAWLWVLAAGGWANRVLEDVIWPGGMAWPLWWTWVLALVPLAGLLKGGTGGSYLRRMVRSRSRLLRRAGGTTLLASTAFFLAYSTAGQGWGVLIYSAQIAAAVSSAVCIRSQDLCKYNRKGRPC